VTVGSKAYSREAVVGMLDAVIDTPFWSVINGQFALVAAYFR
jgi:hypothetical protein